MNEQRDNREPAPSPERLEELIREQRETRILLTRILWIITLAFLAGAYFWIGPLLKR